MYLYNRGYHQLYSNKEMDCCHRPSSILHTRLFAYSERIHVADRGSVTRISTHYKVSRLLG